MLVIGHGNTELYYESGLLWSKELRDITVEYVDTYEGSKDSQMIAAIFEEEGLSIGSVYHGDSGGPLVWRKADVDTVVGVASFVLGNEDPGQVYGCLGSPGGYARVSYGYDWIMETMWTLCDFPMAGLSPRNSPSVHRSSSPSVDPSESPSVSPSLSPNSSPCSNPSLRPSTSPSSSPSDNCQDDPDWEFREILGQSCQWFQKDKQHTCRNPVKFCGKTANSTGPSNTDKTKVWAYCKRTCYKLGNTNGCK